MPVANCYTPFAFTTTATTTNVLQPFVQDYLRKPVPEETFTHSHQSSSSFISFLHQLMCLTVFLVSAHPIFKFCLVYLLVWIHPLHTPFISSPNHCLLFATRAYHHHLIFCSTEIISSIPSLSTLLELYPLPWRHTSVWPFSSLPSDVPPHFLSLEAWK